tara:strand:- start:1640 stop:2260 length:621 start_codon:yes stop_codon:yes gene_type:complete
MEVTKVDGRLVRAQKTYDEIHSKLLKSAVELFNNSPLQPEKITVTEIAKHAGVSTATAYNHFPENKLDIYGSLFQEGFKDVVTDFEIFMKSDPISEEAIKTFLNVIAMKCVELGDAIRFAWFQVRDIQSTGKWIQNEPYDVLYNLCKNHKNVDPRELANEIFQMFNGITFLWLRYDENYPVWSKYTDEWYLDNIKKIFDKAIKILK